MRDLAREISRDLGIDRPIIRAALIGGSAFIALLLVAFAVAADVLRHGVST